MTRKTDRRTFVKTSIAAPAALALSLRSNSAKAYSDEPADRPANPEPAETTGDALPRGKIGNLEISRLLLGGNLLTHYTHSRDLKYVYQLAALYNTEEKILQTLALAEKHGINTLVIHTEPKGMNVVKKYRFEQGGKIQWIICPTAPVEEPMDKYTQSVERLAEMKAEAVYLWGVRSDMLFSQGKLDLIAKAVEVGKEHGLPSGVGAHDLNVVMACERNGINADFYILTFHHHKYPTGPRPDELTVPYIEIPGYWCRDPEKVVDFMKDVEKPWIAFKVMAAGAIPPDDAFEYAFKNGADHVLAGMFDFEIEEDVGIVKEILPKVERERPWRS